MNVSTPKTKKGNVESLCPGELKESFRQKKKISEFSCSLLGGHKTLSDGCRNQLLDLSE